MSLRIPANQIVKSKYTIGKEYMFENTYREYQGYYYETKGKLFAGKEFNINAPVLVKINFLNTTPLRTNPATFVYGIISGIKLNSAVPPSFIFQYNSNTRYFSYQLTKKLIKEIDKDTFTNFQSNPLYVIVSLSYAGKFKDSELKEAEKKIPGITTYVNTSYTNPSIEESGLIG
jgi:hypothetical protein